MVTNFDIGASLIANYSTLTLTSKKKENQSKCFWWGVSFAQRSDNKKGNWEVWSVFDNFLTSIETMKESTRTFHENHSKCPMMQSKVNKAFADYRFDTADEILKKKLFQSQ